jgi:hypothetical protein
MHAGRLGGASQPSKTGMWRRHYCPKSGCFHGAAHVEGPHEHLAQVPVCKRSASLTSPQLQCSRRRLFSVFWTLSIACAIQLLSMVATGFKNFKLCEFRFMVNTVAPITFETPSLDFCNWDISEGSKNTNACAKPHNCAQRFVGSAAADKVWAAHANFQTSSCDSTIAPPGGACTFHVYMHANPRTSILFVPQSSMLLFLPGLRKFNCECVQCRSTGQ